MNNIITMIMKVAIEKKFFSFWIFKILFINLFF